MLHQANDLDESRLLEQCNAHCIEHVCTLLALNRSSIYRHKQVKPKQISGYEQHIVQRICAIFKMSGQNYGSGRIQRALHAENIIIGRYKIRRIMRQQGLKTTWAREFTRTTDSKHKMKVAENILNQQFNSDRPNNSWVADITYIWTASGWLYLAAVMDLYSRKIVGYRPYCEPLSVCIINPLNERLSSVNRNLQCSTDQISSHAIGWLTAISKFARRTWHCMQYEPYQVRLHSKLGYLSPNSFEQKTTSLSIGVSDFT